MQEERKEDKANKRHVGGEREMERTRQSQDGRYERREGRDAKDIEERHMETGLQSICRHAFSASVTLSDNFLRFAFEKKAISGSVVL